MKFVSSSLALFITIARTLCTFRLLVICLYSIKVLFDRLTSNNRKYKIVYYKYVIFEVNHH